MNPRVNLGRSMADDEEEETFTRIFDRCTTGWYFALLCVLAVCYFGSGVLVAWTDKRAERVEQAEYVALVYKIDKAKVGKTIQLRGKGFFVTRLNGVIGDEAFKEKGK